ncbi:hypothetical protein Pan2_06 [Pseudanabaena phage Pan2]|nr:hypothetical protein Pan2_06 [Pseudanabaena phage Pan2]
MPAPKPIVLTRAATNTASGDPEPMVVIGDFPTTALTAVPGSFADLAAVQTYLSTLVGQLKASPYFS